MTIGFLIGQIIGIAVWSLIWGRFLQWFTKMGIKTNISFKDSYLTTFIVGLFTWIIGIIINSIIPNIQNRQGPVVILTMVIGYIGGTLICSKRIRFNDGIQIGLKRAAGIMGMLWGAQLLLLVIIVGFILFLSKF